MPALHFATWEYNPEGTIPEPISRVTQWVMDSLKGGRLSWRQCQMLVVVGGRRGAPGARIEMLTPALHDRRQPWLMEALVGRDALLVVLSAAPPEILESFEPMSMPAEGPRQLECSPWDIPPGAVPDIEDMIRQAGQATIVGHDAQFILTAEVQG